MQLAAWLQRKFESDTLGHRNWTLATKRGALIKHRLTVATSAEQISNLISVGKTLEVKLAQAEAGVATTMIRLTESLPQPEAGETDWRLSPYMLKRRYHSVLQSDAEDPLPTAGAGGESPPADASHARGGG